MFVLAGGVGQQRDNEWKCAPLSSEPRANNRPLASSFAKASRDPNNANSRKEYIMPAFTKVGLDALLTPENCAVLLIDHQPSQLANVNSHDPTLVINNVTALAKTAKAYGVPTILTTIAAKRGGEIFTQIQSVFPDQKPIDRSFINSWEDRRVVEAVKNTGRKKLVIAALWSEMCLAQPAIHAMGDGYDVYAVTDASGGVSPEAHDMAIRRIVAAGAQPMTWLGMAGELQRDWARTERLGAVAQILFDHAGASGAVLGWELANEAQHA
jgi:nicotinamidase-related amidase